jgi:hypothetical protein
MDVCIELGQRVRVGGCRAAKNQAGAEIARPDGQVSLSHLTNS